MESLTSTHPNVPEYTSAAVHTHFKLGVLWDRLAERSPQGPSREVEQQAGVSFRKAAEGDGDAVLIRRAPGAVDYLAWRALFLQF